MKRPEPAIHPTEAADGSAKNDPGAHSGGALRSLYVPLLLTALVVIVLDQVTKSWALDALADRTIDLLGDAVTLRLTYNPGGAFSLLQGAPGFFVIATVVVVVLILMWARRIESRALAVSLGLVLGGGLGNLADRVVRDTGGRVIDFVDLHWWPVFNLADSAISVGVVLILILSWREDRRAARVRP